MHKLGPQLAKLKWALFFTLVFLLAREYGWTSATATALNKPLGALLGAIWAHGFRQTVFWYIDLSELYNGNDPRFPSSFLGLCILYAAFIIGAGAAL